MVACCRQASSLPAASVLRDPEPEVGSGCAGHQLITMVDPEPSGLSVWLAEQAGRAQAILRGHAIERGLGSKRYRCELTSSALTPLAVGSAKGEALVSLRLAEVVPVPAATMQVAKAAFPKGCPAMRETA